MGLPHRRNENEARNNVVLIQNALNTLKLESRLPTMEAAFAFAVIFFPLVPEHPRRRERVMSPFRRHGTGG